MESQTIFIFLTRPKNQEKKKSFKNSKSLKASVLTHRKRQTQMQVGKDSALLVAGTLRPTTKLPILSVVHRHGHLITPHVDGGLAIRKSNNCFVQNSNT